MYQLSAICILHRIEKWDLVSNPSCRILGRKTRRTMLVLVAIDQTQRIQFSSLSSRILWARFFTPMNSSQTWDCRWYTDESYLSTLDIPRDHFWVISARHDVDPGFPLNQPCCPLPLVGGLLRRHGQVRDHREHGEARVGSCWTWWWLASLLGLHSDLQASKTQWCYYLKQLMY